VQTVAIRERAKSSDDSPALQAQNACRDQQSG